jgi:hypothetical protein
MGIVFKGVQSNYVVDQRYLSVSVPTHTDGDLLIMALASSYVNAFDPELPSGIPAGWNPASLPVNDYQSPSGGLWWRFASSEPASYTIDSHDSSLYDVAGAILSYGAVGNPNPIRSSSSGHATGPSVTSQYLLGMVDGDLGIIYYAGRDISGQSSYTVSPPGGSWNTRVNLVTSYGTSTVGCLLVVVDKLNGTDTPTCSVNTTYGQDWSVASAGLASYCDTGFFPLFT